VLQGPVLWCLQRQLYDLWKRKRTGIDMCPVVRAVAVHSAGYLFSETESDRGADHCFGDRRHAAQDARGFELSLTP